MIFLVVGLIGSLVPVILIVLLWLLNFVFVLNVRGIWRMFFMTDSNTILVVLVFLGFCFFSFGLLYDSMF